MTPPNNEDPILSEILECLKKRKQNHVDREALDLELGHLFQQKRNEFTQDREFGKWLRSAKLADHIKLTDHIKQREAHTLRCVAKAYPDGLPDYMPKSSAEKLAAPMHDEYRTEVLEKLKGKKNSGKDIDKEISAARARAGLEEKPKISAKRHKPQTPPLEDVQALVDMLIDGERLQVAKPSDVQAAIDWLRDISGYGDSIKNNSANGETISTEIISDDARARLPTVTCIPKSPLRRCAGQEPMDKDKQTSPRPIA